MEKVIMLLDNASGMIASDSKKYSVRENQEKILETKAERWSRKTHGGHS